MSDNESTIPSAEAFPTLEAPHVDDPTVVTAEEDNVLEQFEPVDEADRPRAVIHIRRRIPGSRVDKYIKTRFPKVSRTTIQRLIKQGDITVNGRPTKPSYEMEDKDEIEIVFPPPVPYDVMPENIPLDIIYEDDFLLAINKPAGIIAHPANRTQGGTVANAMAYYCKTLSRGSTPARPGIVHRLDKNTTGIMLIAKTDEAHWRLSQQFENRTTEKIYLAVVHGEPEFDEDVIDVPIGQHETVHDRYVATGLAERIGGKFERKLGKSAITKYKVLRRYGGAFALIELTPKTGRTHQLRIHMSFIKHPIVGDPFYGGRNVSMRYVTGKIEDSDEPCFRRQMLHAHRLTVKHPIHETPLTIEAPLAADMRQLVDLLDARYPRKKR